MVLLRVHDAEGRLEEWALVLASIGVSSRIESGASGFHLLVADHDYSRAQETLRAFEQENRAEPERPLIEHGASWLGVLIAVALVVFFLLTGDRSGARWFSVGSADAERLLGGQWWRALTALTLHADFAHVLSNAFATLILVGALARALGPGVTSALLLAAGAFGNYATALAHRSHHDSIGASTAVFAAVGALATLSFFSRKRSRLPWRRPWLALAAALALLGLLGTAKGTDVLAHGFGLVFGALFCVPIALLPILRNRIAQAVLSLVSLGVIVAAWELALQS
jgi:membrane associated rhomboid family serine protease